MLNNLKEIWDFLEGLNVAKLYISYTAKKKQDSDLSFKVENIIATSKNADDSKISWDSEIFKEDSFFVSPIKKEHKQLIGKADGLLIYDNIKKEITLRGKYKKKIVEDYKIKVDEKPIDS